MLLRELLRLRHATRACAVSRSDGGGDGGQVAGLLQGACQPFRYPVIGAWCLRILLAEDALNGISSAKGW